MKLIIAEKPSVARDIARVLGVNEKNEGFLKGNDYIVSWALGHLVGLMDPNEIDPKYQHWRKEDLPMLPESFPLKILPNCFKQFRLLKKLMNSPEISSLICATDSGREGELIFRYIYQMAECRKPFQRLWISSMTDEAIRNGFASLKPSEEYDALYESARCRSEADWLVGMNASRAFTIHYHVLLSVGRVQTPTLNMLVKRRREIDSFKPEPYWMVEAQFGSFTGTWFDKEHDGFQKRITERKKAEEIVQRVSGKTAKVLSAKGEEKKELPPQLFDLTTLQKEASSLYSFTAAKTLKLAQSLYETRKLITYPRTDSRYLSHDMPASVVKALKGLGTDYSEIAKPVLEKPIPMSKRIFDDAKLTDHHAIIPTGQTPKADLPEDERKLFDMIARQLIAAFYPPRRTSSCTVVTECCMERFVSTCTTVLDEGFKAVLPAKPKKSGKNQELGSIQLGEEFSLKTAKVLDKLTEAPREYTDGTLLNEMENAGRSIEDEALREKMKACSLGTPATRAATIERLMEVGYAVRKGKNILATEKGCLLIDAVPSEIASPEITGKWEEALEKIALGKGDTERFMQGIRRMTAFLTEYADTKAPEVAFQPEESKRKGGKSSSKVHVTDMICPLCGKGRVQETEKAFGCSEWRNGCKFTLWKDGASKSGGPILNEKVVKALLASPNLSIAGSTGILSYHDGFLYFQPKK